MYHKKLEAEIRCPLERGLSMFGGKWKCRILCVLAKGQPMRYSAILREMTNITDAVLSASLRELVRDGLLERMQYAEIPPRVEYRLTEHGTELLPILASISRWAGACPRENPPGSAACQSCDYSEKSQETGE